MTMLNEEIVKEMSKYDDMFNGFSYNDIVPEELEEVEILVLKAQNSNSSPTDITEGGLSTTGITTNGDNTEQSPHKVSDAQGMSPTGQKDNEGSSDSEKEEENIKREILKHQASMEADKTKIDETKTDSNPPNLEHKKSAEVEQ